MNTGGATPTPERLAAFADGELRGAERAAVEAWLEGCPQARAEVEAFRRLACQCRRTAASEPPHDAWDTVLHNIHAAVPAGYRPVPLPRRRRPFTPAAVGAAAAVFAGIVVGNSFWSKTAAPPATVVIPIKEPLYLADAREVDIISIDDGDASSLLIGRPPIRDPLQLAGPGDVTLVGLESTHGIAPGLSPIVPADAKDPP
jgi:hypothetical protein